ncbi:MULTISPECIES: hypothetical protein [unclassified Kribbella]|uniref:hypothetical protein n=1 Tax=unclassified Kribbella TaxID=2644121 RepID=UPI0030192D12
MTAHGPLPRATAFGAVAHCAVATVRLAGRRRIHHPREHVGRRLRFADGTQSRVYRETVVDRPPTTDPCVLVVAFRLRRVRGRGHTLFRWESWFNIPLFVGFDGFVSKLWLAHDDFGTYRGVYEWDGPESAEAYARALWRVLELVSVKGSIRYQVIPGLRCDDLLADAHVLDPVEPAGQGSWWRMVAPA